MIGNLKIYLLAALAAFLLWQGGSYALTRYGESRYESGVTAGINKEAERRNKIDRDLAEMRQREKDQDDRDTTRRIDQALADAASAVYAADRLRQQLNAATAIAKQRASAVGVSSDAGTLADLLAELFYQSVQAGNELAAEADRYYIAGQRCNAQYNRLLQAKRSNK